MGDPSREAKPKTPSKPQTADNQQHDSAIRVDPSGLMKTVLLGGEQRLRYSVNDLRVGAHVKWQHSVSGVKAHEVVHEGPTSELRETATHAGEREIDTVANIDGRSETAPTLTLTTPRSPMRIVGSWAESKERGRTPVADVMQANEDLVLHVEIPDLDPSVDKLYGVFDTSLATVTSMQKLEENKFEVALKLEQPAKPAKPADASKPLRGGLVVSSPRVSASSVDHARVSMQVEPARGVDEFGKRSATTALAVDGAVGQWDLVYDKRLDAIDLLMKEISVVDPVPPDPLWVQALKTAATIALGAATAGIGAGLVKGLADSSAFQEGMKELTKVLLEASSAGVIENAVDAALSGPEAEAEQPSPHKTRGGAHLSAATYFEWTQRSALRAAKLDHRNRVASTLTSLTTRLDRDHPSMGYRAAEDARRVIESQNKFAAEQQFTESLMAWCRFIAQTKLKLGDQARGRDPGTELGSQIDVKKILPQGDANPVNLDKTPGVLRLELAEIAPGHIIVVRAFIAGFTGDTVVRNLTKKVGELSIPIVARFNRRTPMGDLTQQGFVISRNENGAVLADSKGGLMQEMFGGRSDHEAARLVFDQIAYQTITPERG